jgi:hypothetical protein
VEVQNADNMRTYQDWDGYDDCLQQRLEEDYEIAMALQPSISTGFLFLYTYVFYFNIFI